MGTKITYLCIAAIAVVEFLTVKAWFVCKSFTDLFHLASINITLQIEDYIHLEKGTPLFLTRLFTNKIVNSFFDLFRLYFRFWDIRFGASWFSLIGYFGIFAGFYYIFSNNKKRWYHWVMVILILVLPVFEVVKGPHISLVIKSIYLWAPFCLFSLYGIYQFLTHGNRKLKLVIILLLTILSIWWIYFLPFTMPPYCIKPNV
ncbi:MAG TPA: hypothetical protein VLF89_04700 [Candidatus Saccharimonadales bacterium]|nr:hypothetical protein [Candidatus Saccharimonadales bacterium]